MELQNSTTQKTQIQESQEPEASPNINKKVIIFAISMVVSAVLFWLIARNVHLNTFRKAIRILSVPKLILAAIPFLVAFFLGQLRWRILLKSKHPNIKISQWDTFVSKFVDFTVSYITPMFNMGGEPARAYYLNKKTGISFADSLALSFIDKLIETIGYLVLMLIGFFAIISHVALPEKIEYVFAGVFIFCTLLIYVLYRRIQNKQKLFSRFLEVTMLDKIKFIGGLKGKIIKIEEQIVDFFHNHNAAFKKMMLITLIMRALMVLGYWFLMNLLGMHFGFFAALAMTSVIIFSYFSPTPGSLGTFEAAAAFAPIIFNAPLEKGLLIGLIMRGMYTFAFLIGVFILFHYFSGDILKNLFGMKEK